MGQKFKFEVLNYKNDEAHAIDIGPDGSVYVVGDNCRSRLVWNDHDN